jgi:hypothetical protein
MKNKVRRIFESLETKATILSQKDVKEIHPVVKDIVNAFGELEFMRTLPA